MMIAIIRRGIQKSSFASEEEKKERIKNKWDYRYNKFWEEFYKEDKPTDRQAPPIDSKSQKDIKKALLLYAFLGE